MWTSSSGEIDEFLFELAHSLTLEIGVNLDSGQLSVSSKKLFIAPIDEIQSHPRLRLLEVAFQPHKDLVLIGRTIVVASRGAQLSIGQVNLIRLKPLVSNDACHVLKRHAHIGCVESAKGLRPGEGRRILGLSGLLRRKGKSAADSHH